MAGNYESIPLGILFKILNVLSAVVMLSLVRGMMDIPITQIMFFRAAFAIVPIAVWLVVRRGLRDVLRTRRLGAHVRRTIVGLVCTGLVFVAIQNLPLTEAVTLQYTQPLFVVAFSVIFLGDTVGAVRWGALLFGFSGVLVVSWPQLSLLNQGVPLTQSEIIGIAAAMLASSAVAAVLLLVGDLVRTESPETITVYAWIISTLLLATTALAGWEPLTAKQAALLVLTGIIGGLVQLFMALSLKHAPASSTASFEYTSLIFATLIGFVFFDEIPRLATLVGGAMVVCAGLVIMARENTLRRRARATKGKIAP